MLTPSQKGSIAESAIVHAAIKLGIGVYKPVNEGLRYDLIFDVGSRLVRVQCKWALRHGEVVVVPCRSVRRTRLGVVRRLYTAEEVDAFAAYCNELDRCYFLALDRFAGRTAVQLRLVPARNNQRLGIVWADDHDFARLHWHELALSGP